MNCSFCGKPDTPVRQVPARIPVSDCYCDVCVSRAIAYWTRVEKTGREIPVVLEGARYDENGKIVFEDA